MASKPSRRERAGCWLLLAIALFVWAFVTLYALYAIGVVNGWAWL